MNPRGIKNDYWFTIGGGDGFFAQPDPNDSNIVYAESQDGNLIRRNVLFFVGYRPDEEEFEQLWEDLTVCYGGELPRCHLAVSQGTIDDYQWQRWVWRGLLLFHADPIECMEELQRRVEEGA